MFNFIMNHIEKIFILCAIGVVVYISAIFYVIYQQQNQVQKQLDIVIEQTAPTKNERP